MAKYKRPVIHGAAVRSHGHNRMGVETIVAFGGNMGDVLPGFVSAREQLGCTKGLRILDSSHAYPSPPMGPPGQPDYLNAIVVLDTDMDAETLLRHLQDIENQHGRIRTDEHWGPRTLDLDFIAYNDTVMQTKHLTLPHPHMHERMFVLQPMCDIRPNWRHPILKQSTRALLKMLTTQGIPRLEEKQAW